VSDSVKIPSDFGPSALFLSPAHLYLFNPFLSRSAQWFLPQTAFFWRCELRLSASFNFLDLVPTAVFLNHAKRSEMVKALGSFVNPRTFARVSRFLSSPGVQIEVSNGLRSLTPFRRIFLFHSLRIVDCGPATMFFSFFLSLLFNQGERTDFPLFLPLRFSFSRLPCLSALIPPLFSPPCVMCCWADRVMLFFFNSSMRLSSVLDNVSRVLESFFVMVSGKGTCCFS